MAYRDDTSDALEAPTAEGLLRMELGPRSIKLAVGHRTLQIADRFATLTEHKKKQPRATSFKIEGRLITARDVPHDDLGVWIEVTEGEGTGHAMRRIFGVEPVSLLEPSGLADLARLDKLAQRLRVAVADLAGDVRRAFEIGRGLDKVLLADQGTCFVLYARKLFSDRARSTLEIHDDGRIVIVDGKASREIVVRSRYGVTVWGDHLRFADPHGTDLAKVAIPWIDAEDRRELARRIGQLIDAPERNSG